MVGVGGGVGAGGFVADGAEVVLAGTEVVVVVTPAIARVGNWIGCSASMSSAFGLLVGLSKFDFGVDGTIDLTNLSSTLNPFTLTALRATTPVFELMDSFVLCTCPFANSASTFPVVNNLPFHE